MKSFFLILFFVFALFVIKSEADTQWISEDVESNEVDEEVLDNLIDDLMRNNNYKAIKSGNSQCTSIGGQCMNTNNCKNGIIKAGLCSGGNNIKCCILKKTTTNKTTTKKTTVKKNTTNRNAVNRNAVNRNAVKKNTVKKNTVNRNAVKKNTVKKNTVNRNAVKKNTVKNNTVKKNTVKNNTVKKNTVNKCISQKGRCMNPSNCKNGIVRAGLCPGGNNVKCCIPKKTTTKKTTVKQNTVKKNTVKKNTVKKNTVRKNTVKKTTVKKNTVNKCTSQKGRCMNPNNCKNGTVKAGLCPGSNNLKCCIPKKTTNNNNTGNKNTGNKNTIYRCKGKKCISSNNTNNKCKGGKCLNSNVINNIVNKNKCAIQGGKCMNPSNCKNGTVRDGLCPGGNNNKCCIPKTNTGNRCKGKKCMSSNTTNNTANNTANKNKCTNQGGKCMDPNSCTGTVVNGLCPGGQNNKCCIKKINTGNTGNTGNIGNTSNTGITGNTGNTSSTGSTGSSPTVSYSLEQKIKIIYNYIMSNVPGATKNGIAAVLGNWKVESNIEPKRAEADYVSPPIGAASKSDPCWDNEAWLSMTGPEIYKGKYPKILKRGLGLGQWTDTSGSPRNTNLRNYANSKGMKWYDLNLQLDFMLHGDSSYAITQVTNVLTSNESVNTLTTRFLNKWEGNKGDKLAERQQGANEMYNYLVNNF